MSAIPTTSARKPWFFGPLPDLFLGCGLLYSGFFVLQAVAQPRVRQALLGLQHRLGETGEAVLEGRDIGTVVFPDADIKIYLEATPEERGRRRYAELLRQGESNVSLAATIQEMAERDQRDTERAHAPLRAADDAVRIDTTTLTLPEVVDRMAELVNAHASIASIEGEKEKPGL